MAILEQAADALVKKLLEFKTEAEAATEQLEELKDSVGEHDEGLDDDWSEFTEAVQTLLRTVGERGAKLDPAAGKAQGAVETLGTLTGEVKDSVEETLGASDELLGDLKDQASGLESDVERLAGEGAETPSDGVEEQLDSVLQGVQKTAEEGVEAIRETFVKEVEEAVGGAELMVKATEKILTDAGNWMKQSVILWTSKMTEVEDTVANDAFKKAGEQAPLVVDEVMTALATAQETAIAEVEKLVGQARQALDELQLALEQADGTLDAAGGGLKTQAEDFVAAIGEASEALARVTQVLVDHRAM